MRAVAADAHGGILLRDGHVRDHFGHGAMEVRIQADEIGHAGKQPQRLAHDVDGDGRVQRRKGRVALHLVDQLRRNELVLLHRRTAANHAMADGRRGRKVAGVQRVGHQLEGHGALGQSRSLIDELLALGVLDPELAQIGADAVHRALEKPVPLAIAGLIDGKFDGR